MPRFSFNKSSFLGGELSARVDGRADLPQYNLGLKQCRNMIVLPSGGVTRRPGTIFVEDVRGGDTDGISSARIIDFVVSEDQPYIVILWNNTVSGLTEIRVINANTLAVQTLTSYVTLDYSDEELRSIQYVQSGDLMVMVVDGREPVTLWRTSAGFFVDEYLTGLYPKAGALHLRPPYELNAQSSLTMTPSATTGAITITASSAYFTAGHVGSFVRIYAGASQGYAIITGYVSPTVVNALTYDDYGVTTASSDWAISEFSVERGFPRAVCFYNQRLVFGGTTTKPDTFWASQAGDLFQFEPVGTGLADAQSFTLASNRNNRIQWMDGGKRHTIGTLGGEWVGGFREDGTNLSVEYSQETMHGSAYVQPSKIGNGIAFLQSSRSRVREIVYNNDEGGYVANDLTLLKEDLAEGSKIDQMIETYAPYQISWLRSRDGYLYGITRDRGQQIAAWHSHQIGGRIDTGVDYANAAVISACSVPAEAGGFDQLWLVVNRTINGNSVFYLEKMDKFRSNDRLEFLGNTGDDWFYFVDSAKAVYNAVAANVIAGFGHLIGESVDVMADGKYVGQVTVDGSGQITLPSSLTANRVVAGFGYKSRIKTMRQEGGSAIGSSVGSLRRADRVYINVFKSRFFKFGAERPAKLRQLATVNDDATQVDYFDQFCEEHALVDPGEIMGDPYWTNSEIVQKAIPHGYDDAATMIVLIDKPYPLTVLSLTTRMLESDI